MSYWKILGGAMAGIGAVACLPVLGGIGAVSLVGATIGGVVGGLGGLAMAVSDEEKESNAYDNGKAKIAAEYEIRIRKLTAAFEEAKNKLDGDKTYFQLIISLFAMGLATANADGEISQEEHEDLDQFVYGIIGSALPNHIQQQIQMLRQVPPTLNEAIEYIKKIDSPDIELFRSVITLISESDGKVTSDERVFLKAFDQRIIEIFGNNEKTWKKEAA